jgi:bis(5'-nucleosyl)-tetraphosphatase (symmetrical)
VGDLVGRGPRSLEVLRWAREVGERIVTVLGNHDLHLLARALGVAPPKKKDLLRSLSAVEDKEDLLGWLRDRPLIHSERPYALVHAGLLPQWTIEEAERYGREVEQVLNGPQAGELLRSLTWKEVPVWDERLSGFEKHGSILRAMTELRTIRPDGSMCLDFTGPLSEIPKGAIPWFSAPLRKSRQQTILFGHWAALGFYQAPGILALDSGCAWGGMLTAVRLEDNAVFQQPNTEETPR